LTIEDQNEFSPNYFNVNTKYQFCPKFLVVLNMKLITKMTFISFISFHSTISLEIFLDLWLDLTSSIPLIYRIHLGKSGVLTMSVSVAKHRRANIIYNNVTIQLIIVFINYVRTCFGNKWSSLINKNKNKLHCDGVIYNILEQ
jgi:hypothetical protein